MGLLYNYCGMTQSPGNSARVVVNSDTDGVLTAVVDGQTHTGDTIDQSVMFGTGRVDITGLQPGRVYDVDLFIDGVFQKRTKAKTLSTTFVRKGFASCLAVAGYQKWASYLQKRNPDIVFFAGDFDYEDNPSYNQFQDPVVVCTTNALDIENRYVRIRNRFILPEVQALMDTGVMFLFQYDDHEMFNSWCFDPSEPDMAALRHPGVITSAPTAEQLLDIWQAHTPYLDMLHYGNPDMEDGVIGDVPSGATSTSATTDDFIPRYFRVDIPGMCRLMSWDCQTFRSPLQDADNGSQSPIVKTMLGPTQRAWTATHGAANTLPFGLVLTGKYLWELANEGTTSPWDRWNVYPSERAWLAAEIANWSATTPTIAGDVHIPNIGSDGNVWNFCICPCGVATVQRDAIPGSNTRIVYGSGFSDIEKYIGEIDITRESMTVTLHDFMRERSFQPVTFTPGSGHMPSDRRRAIA